MQRFTKLPPRMIRESGQAAFVGLVVALTVVAALALPAYEAARAVNDRILAASAAEDAAKALAAQPSMTLSELEGYLGATYPQIAENATLSATIGPQKIVPYTHRLYASEGGLRMRPSNATGRDAAVTVEVSKGFSTAAGYFIGLVTGTGGYTVSATGHAVIDETVSSGGW